MAAFRPIRLCAVVLLLSPCGLVRASGPAAGEAAARAVSLQEFGADVQRLEVVVSACASQSGGCDAGGVGSDERVGEADHGGFAMSWGWLRSALGKAKDAKAEDRRKSMAEALAQLQAIAQEGGSAAEVKDFARARGEANAVLRTPEFESADGPTWWDRKLAQMRNLLARLFDGVGRLGTMAPWLGKLLEWLLFLGAAVGLLVFLLRTLARQRMRIALGDAAPAATAWQREATDWARMADRHAAASEWREAVHCLYWAAIVLLEGRRAWRHNPTRTPREYVRLLKPGSAQQLGLRGLTQVFERVWYGQRAADAEAYRRARGFFQQLETGAEAAVVGTGKDLAGARA